MQRCRYYVLGGLVALLLLVGLGACGTAKHATSATVPLSEAEQLLAERLRSRYLQLNVTDLDHISPHLHRLWMAYLADNRNPEVLQQLSVLFSTFVGDKEVALEYLEAAFRESGKDYYIGVDLAELASELGAWGVAEEAVLELVQQKPDRQELQVLLVDIYTKQQKGEEALALVRQIRGRDKRYHENPLLLMREATILVEQLGRVGEAEQVLLQYGAEHPSEPMSAMMLVNIYEETEQQSKATALVADMRRRMGFTSPAQEFIAYYYAKNEQYPELVSFIEEATGQSADGATLAGNLVQVAQEATPSITNLLPHLLPLQQGLVARYPQADLLAVRLAGYHLLLKDTVASEAILKELVAKGSKEKSAYHILLQKYSTEENKEALSWLVQKGVQVLPNDGLLRLNDAFLSVQAGDTLTYNRKIEEALALVPEEDSYHALIGLMYADNLVKADSLQAAKPYYEKAVHLGIPVAYNNYAYALATHGTKQDLVKAEEMARQAVQLSGDEPSHLDTYAWILHLRGSHSLARIYMEKAIAKVAEPEALYYEHYAEILQALEEYKSAREAWLKVRELGNEAEQKKATERIEQLDQVIKEK